MTYRILLLLLLTVVWAQSDEGSGLLDSMEAAEPGNGTGSGEPEPGPEPVNTTEPASSYDETVTALLTDPTDLPSTTPIDIESLIGEWCCKAKDMDQSALSKHSACIGSSRETHLNPL